MDSCYFEFVLIRFDFDGKVLEYVESELRIVSSRQINKFCSIIVYDKHHQFILHLGSKLIYLVWYYKL